MAITSKERINTVNLNRCIVYRISQDEISSGIVSIQNGNGDQTAYLRFDTSAGSGNAVWQAFKNWWKANPNAILLGCMVWNNGTNASQNKGYYWSPVNRCAMLRNDNWTKYLEFTIQRGDTGIFQQGAATVYEFYFINLTH